MDFIKNFYDAIATLENAHQALADIEGAINDMSEKSIARGARQNRMSVSTYKAYLLEKQRREIYDRISSRASILLSSFTGMMKLYEADFSKMIERYLRDRDWETSLISTN